MMTNQTKEVGSRRQTCTDHCPGCGGHFHGLGAFDAHLKRVSEEPNRWGIRRYDLEHQASSTAGLEPWTEDGFCDLLSPSVAGVTIWRKPLTDWVRAWKAGGPVETTRSTGRSAQPPSRSGPEGPMAEGRRAQGQNAEQLTLLGTVALDTARVS